EALGDHPQAVLAEMLGLDAQRLGERAHHVVRGHRSVPVNEMVEIAGGEFGLVGERPVGDAGFVHQLLDRRAERLLAEPALPPGPATPCRSYGATDRAHLIPCSSWCCSTIAAMTRPGPMP